MAESNFIDYVKIYCASGHGGAGSAHLRQENENAVDERGYACSTIYMNLVEECEQCGDYIVNVVEAKTGQKLEKMPKLRIGCKTITLYGYRVSRLGGPVQPL